MPKRLGGGSLKQITAVRGKERVDVTARMRLWGVNLGIVTGSGVRGKARAEPYEGEIVMPVWKTTVQRARTPSAVPNYVLLPSVYSAFRQTVHTLYTYGAGGGSGEKDRLLRADEAARAVHLTFLSLAPGTTPAEAAELLHGALEYLRRVLGAQPRAMTKKEALRHVQAFLRGKDSLGRMNPSVGMTRALVLQRLLHERLEDEIMRIEPSIAARQKVLLGLIHLAQERLAQLDAWVTPFIRREGLRLLFLPRGVQQLSLQCQHQMRALEQIDYQPFVWMCQESVHDLREIRFFLAQRDLAPPNLTYEVARRLLIVQSANAVKRQQIEIERVIFQMLRSEMLQRGLSVRQMHVRLRTIDRGLDAIDESEFRVPVCTKARGYLAASIALLERGGKPDYTAIRKSLKAASQVL